MSLIGLQLKLVQTFPTHLQFCKKGLKHLQVHGMSSQELQPFAKGMAVTRIFVELGHSMKFMSLWP